MGKKKTKELTIHQKENVEWWQKLITDGKAGEEVQSRMSKSLCSISPEYLCEEFAKKVAIKVAKGEELNKEDNDLLYKVGISLGFENNLSMLEAIEDQYRSLMMSFKKGLIKEYDCKTISEKALVDIIANAYARNLTYSKKLMEQRGGEYFSKERNGFLAVMSKEIDRANRHFITALETLRQMKQPELNINVRAKTAFISQNQQFNNNQDKQNEAIEAK